MRKVMVPTALLAGLSILAGPSAQGHPERTEVSQGEDLLTFARGVLFVSQTGLASGSSVQRHAAPAVTLVRVGCLGRAVIPSVAKTKGRERV